jgi:hypothetical protein
MDQPISGASVDLTSTSVFPADPWDPLTLTVLNAEALNMRGYYFNGESTRAELTVVLNSSFTLRYWTLVMNRSADRTSLFYVYSGDASSEAAANLLDFTVYFSSAYRGTSLASR